MAIRTILVGLVTLLALGIAWFVVWPVASMFLALGSGLTGATNVETQWSTIRNILSYTIPVGVALGFIGVIVWMWVRAQHREREGYVY